MNRQIDLGRIFNRHYVSPLLGKGVIARTDPDHPQSPPAAVLPDMSYYVSDTMSTSSDPCIPPLTFDATDSWWTFGAGTYPGTWQVFTMCAGANGSSYPHILEVNIKSATAAKPVFKLTDGVVKLVKNQTTGNTLSLERGIWNFTDPDGETTANDVTLQEGSLLNATWSSGADNNWHGFQFQNPSWGTLRVEGGSTLQTSRFDFLGTGTESRHVEIVFDDGSLDLTSDASGSVLSARTVVKGAYDAFVTTGAGLTIHVGEGVAHTFAAPIKGTGDVRKTGVGTLGLATVVDGGPVTRQDGRFEVAEGTVDLGGETVVISNLCGCGMVANGTLAGSFAVDLGATPDTVVRLADSVDFGSIRLNVFGPHATATVGTRVPLARTGADISASTLAGWRGAFDALADAKSYRIVGAKVENGVVYDVIEAASGCVIYFR